MKIRAQSIGCFDVNFFVVSNVTCRLKPTRDGGGRATLLVNGFKKTSDIWLEAQYFYKNSKNIYMPYFQKFDFNLCKIMAEKASLNLMTALMLKGLKSFSPETFHPCPYSGTVGFRNLSIPHVFENSIPQVIPIGTYKMLWRFYGKKGNITYGNFFGIGEVKAVDVLQGFNM